MLSTVSHTLGAGLCEGRFEADAATAGSLIAPNLYEAAGTVFAVPHNVAAACPLTLSAMRTRIGSKYFRQSVTLRAMYFSITCNITISGRKPEEELLQKKRQTPTVTSKDIVKIYIFYYYILYLCIEDFNRIAEETYNLYKLLLDPNNG